MINMFITKKFNITPTNNHTYRIYHMYIYIQYNYTYYIYIFYRFRLKGWTTIWRVHLLIAMETRCPWDVRSRTKKGRTKWPKKTENWIFQRNIAPFHHHHCFLGVYIAGFSCSKRSFSGEGTLNYVGTLDDLNLEKVWFVFGAWMF